VIRIDFDMVTEEILVTVPCKIVGRATRTLPMKKVKPLPEGGMDYSMMKFERTWQDHRHGSALTPHFIRKAR